jgi:PAS domain S-box-containing protein
MGGVKNNSRGVVKAGFHPPPALQALIHYPVPQRRVGTMKSYSKIFDFYLSTDIAGYKRTHKLLRQERNFAESIVETAQAVILVIDPQGRIIRFNTFFEEISGYRLEEVQGKDWFDTFLPERNRMATRDLFLKAVNNVQTRGNIDTIITRDGRELQIEWYDKTLKNEDGNLIGLLCVGQDVTERKRLEVEREKLIKELQDALAQVKTLQGIIPICMFCKKIRDDKESWHQLEAYISDHSDALFSHGICPPCAKEQGYDD